MVQAEKVQSAIESTGTEAIGVSEGELASRKRAAVELIRNHDTALRSSAHRYSICSDDADDAYQRGIEILLSKAPTTDLRQLLPWTRTVIKHEALAVRKQRQRTMARPGPVSPDDESEDWVNLIPSTGDGPDERVVKREKVARSREALAELKPHELKALTMLAEGYSYAEIATLNRWTRTKVNRCLAEGRQRFRSVFRDSEAGERCDQFEPMISACCDRELGPEKLVELQNHMAACGHCRATLRAYRAAPRAAAALLPAAPLGHSLWERLQEAAISAQMKFQSIGGGGSDSAMGPVVAGGTRGAGAAVVAKVAAICVGTAGGAAACIATGVVPVPQVLADRDERPSVSRTASRPAPVLPVPVAPTPEPEAAEPARPQNNGSNPSKPEVEPEQQVQQTTAPPPTATESEFTAEAAGTPVPAAAPAPAPPPAQTSSVPVGGGGGEFGP